MATSSDADDPSKFELLKDALYDQCQQNGSDSRLYTQKDLLDLRIVPNNDGHMLLRIVQSLTDERLLIPVNDQRVGLAWKWRSREDARKYRMLSEEQAMVYAMVDEAGADGIWNRTLKARLNMHDSVLRGVMKSLEAKGYIKDMKSVEHPNKKMYIKASLRPSERATGGPWYTDSELDEAFINSLMRLVFDMIRDRSTYKSVHGGRDTAKHPRKGIVKGDKGDVRGKKRAAEDMSTDNGMTNHHSTKPHREPQNTAVLPLPAGYNSYPTVQQIAELISESGITNNTTLSTADIQQLVDVLVYDGVVEPILVGKRKGYRVVKAAQLDPTPMTQLFQDVEGVGDMSLKPREMGAGTPENGLTEVPCGRCPVFDLCEEGGPVSPVNCVYFQRWLDLE
ncbi:DNA-directed RNA polymerase III subunit RPC6 [Pleurostoma richardsiae]|uniref:DNA-directed RNA polymerase III subunit RPC6 n=1 Tax=Pleurostoma richardsiae TaxID=41990 RepID=A0AA38RLP6_9PEZI|nr:DNA-directed RNA polymerase III subunit RPC6 [Pleurostoma richardsiae]